MPNTRSAHDLVAVVGAIDPQSANNTSLNSDWVDMAKFSLALFILNIGVTDCTHNMKLQEATDSSGTGAQDLTGKAITQVAATGDNTQVGISVSDENLSRNSGYRYARAVVTLSNATGALVSLTALGVSPKQLPAVDYKHADCLQTIG